MEVKRSGNRIANSTNPIFGGIQVPAPNRSAFDLSYYNRFSSHLLQEIPVFAEEVLPNDVMDYGISVKHAFAPTESPMMQNFDVNYEVFFVPYSALDPDWQEFISGYSDSYKEVPSKCLEVGPSAGNITIHSGCTVDGSLLDFFGYGKPTGSVGSSNVTAASASVIRCSAYPILAYWRIIADWYQNQNVERMLKSSYFAPMFPVQNGYLNSWSTTDNVLAWSNRTLNGYTVSGNPLYSAPWMPFLRRYDRDFLSTAMLSPQMGSPASVRVDQSGSFTIEELRYASALQRFAERSNLAGQRYNEQIYAHFGIQPADSVDKRAEYLGSCSFRVDTHGVTQQTNTMSGQSAISVLGNQAGQLSSSGNFQLFTNKTFSCHGIVICLQSVSIPPAYASRRDYKLQHKSRLDWAWPEFGNLGDSPVRRMDVATDIDFSVADNVLSLKDVIGYNERDMFWKANPDEVHGKMRGYSNQDHWTSAYAIWREIDMGASADEFLYHNQVDSYDRLERKIFGYGSDIIPSGGSVISEVHNICHVLRALPEHNMPMI